MSEVMANATTALAATLGDFGGPSEAEGAGQAQAPEAPSKPEEKPKEPAASPDQTDTEKPEATTADAKGQAKPDAAESADLPEEYAPFKDLLANKKWDVKSKDFVPNTLKAYQELEKLTTQSTQEKSLLSHRQAEFARRLAGDAKSVNEWRKLNGLPEIPVGKSYAEQAKEQAELVSHINRVLSGEDADKSSFNWLNAKLVDGLNDLRIQAAVEAKVAPKTAEQAVQEFRGKAATNYQQHIARTPGDEAVFNEYVMPLFRPEGLMGSLGLDIAHAAITPEHAEAFAKIGRALQMAANYDKAVEEGIKKGVESAMEAKRKAGNAGSVGRQGKDNAGSGSQGDDFTRSMWARRHG